MIRTYGVPLDLSLRTLPVRQWTSKLEQKRRLRVEVVRVQLVAAAVYAVCTPVQITSALACLAEIRSAIDRALVVDLVRPAHDGFHVREMRVLPCQSCRILLSVFPTAQVAIANERSTPRESTTFIPWTCGSIHMRASSTRAIGW